MRPRLNKRLLPIVSLPALLLGGCDYVPSWAKFGDDEKPKLEGQRLSVVAADPALAPDSAVAQAAFQLPAMNANTEWPQHTGFFTFQTANLALSGDLSQSQSASAGDGESFAHGLVPRPVVGAGRVYAMDAAGNVSAHAIENLSTVLWRAPAVAQEDEDDALGGGLAYADGVLYAVSGRGAVSAMDAASGAPRWKKLLNVPLRSAPKVGGGKLLVVTLDNQTLALSTADGEVQWLHRGIAESAGLMNIVSPTVAGDVAVVPYSSGQIYVLSMADGHELWTQSLSHGKHTLASGKLAGVGGDPVVDGEVVVSVGAGSGLSVHALATGERVWEKPIGSINTPWLAGDWLFVLNHENVLVALKKYDGQIRWVSPLPRFEDEAKKRDVITWRGPVMAGGKLLLVSSIGQMVVVDAATGNQERMIDIPSGVATAPVVASGVVLFEDKDADLTALH